MDKEKNDSGFLTSPTVPESKNSGFNIFIVFAVVALFVAAAAVWYSLQSNLAKLTEKSGSQMVVTPTDAAAPTEAREVQGNASIQLRAVEGSVGRVNTPVTIAVFADSDGKDVVGYDVLFDYNEGQFEFKSAVSNASGFKVSASTQKGILALSGYKSVGEKQPSVFANTQIATVVLIPRQTGSFTLAPLASQGQAKSKMMSADKRAIEPRLSSVNIVISD